ncbi:PREDICTED: low-temperature-induced 65 kDa protein isoform X2 [Nelumbo nucifera]|uniref:Low-temperature-induced 65 kDa protein isoform X2 n=1 Tax=Nelumbo nucifera TaxID=4432 RepID=A0A1U8Q2Q1_NELNU|nr:PREDICTED: low-temperature-induced 65 kDa protein isoform X2 [Nelumbo nucifera]
MHNTQVAPVHAHAYDKNPLDPHNVRLQTDEQREKKSVLKKVKDKAKKITDRLGIKKHGRRGHDAKDDDHIRPDHDEGYDEDEEEEEEEDTDEQIEQDPEIHRAPIYESTTARAGEVGAASALGQSRVNLGATSGQLPPLEKDSPAPPKDRDVASHPAPNYQNNATDPIAAGGQETGVEPILGSVGNMKDSKQVEPQAWSYKGNEHHQSSRDLPPSHIDTASGNLQSVPDTEAVVHSQVEEGKPTNQPSHTEKISSATSAIAEKAISAKNVVASKLGYGGNEGEVVHETPEGGDSTKSTPVGEYSKKIAAAVTETLAPVYDKVAEAGSVVVSKMQGMGTESEGGGVSSADKGVSMKEDLTVQSRPGEEEAEKASPPRGRVTESEEVKTRLGSDEECCAIGNL